MGLKDDFIDWFSLEMATEDILRNKSGLGILAPEQYLWMNFLIKKNKLKNYKNSLVKHNIISCYQSEKLLFENFRVFNFESLGIQLEDRIVKGWMYETVIEETFQNKINLMKKYQKNLFFFSRSFYYCLLNNKFWRKQLNSIKKRII